MGYAQGGGLTDAGRASRERIRLQVVERLEDGQKNKEIVAALRVSEQSVERWRRARRDGRDWGRPRWSAWSVSWSGDHSYGYRPCRSALDAVGACRQRCWKYDWVIDRYRPKGTDITGHQPYLTAIAEEINNQPRRCLGCLTPREAFQRALAEGVASTS